MRVLITGGLGAIGLLVAAWVTTSHPNSEVHLLSRSGRGKTESLSSNSPGQLVVHQCDISTSADMADVLGTFTHIIHAGKIVFGLSSSATDLSCAFQ